MTRTSFGELKRRQPNNSPRAPARDSPASRWKPGLSSLVLSIFPGIDLFGRGFEAEGYCVVRGPDLIFGGDVADFHAVPGRFDGVIGGSPCQDFSRLRRGPPTGQGVAMLAEFARVVTEARPSWWWLENVPGVPDLKIPGYSHLRLDLDPRDFGSRQARLRHFQFGHSRGLVPIVTRPGARGDVASRERCCLASEVSRPGRRSWADFCELQGLPRSFALPGMTLAARYRAVGNGVHFLVARAVARATHHRLAIPGEVRLCRCDCGRVLTGRHVLATPACRKRMERRRRRVTTPGALAPAASQIAVPELATQAIDPSQFALLPGERCA